MRVTANQEVKKTLAGIQERSIEHIMSLVLSRNLLQAHLKASEGSSGGRVDSTNTCKVFPLFGSGQKV